MKSPLTKIIVILGPTASGKTSCAVTLAEKIDGEIISADSRQIYRGLDIGTEKISATEMRGIPHHLIDICDPEVTYTTANFVRDADKAIVDIIDRGKTPIITGGTFFYLEALLGLQTLPEVPPNAELRQKLEMESTDTLIQILKEKDLVRAENIDVHNRRRLIRALEIIDALGTVPTQKTTLRYDAHIIGLDVPREILKERINARLEKTLERGLVQETKTLLENGISKNRLEEIGLEYRVVLSYLTNEITHEEMVEILKQKVWQYAKRQLTWLKSAENINWYDPKDTEQMTIDTQKFLLS